MGRRRDRRATSIRVRHRSIARYALPLVQVAKRCLTNQTSDVTQSSDERFRSVGRPSPQGTTTMRSFDGALVPQAFRARTRTKYVPRGTDAAVNVVVLPIA